MADPNAPLILGKKRWGRVKLPTARRSHTYLIGRSGTGKTSEIFNLALQDIRAGRSIGVVDVHGDLNFRLEQTVAHLIPEARDKLRRVVLLDPTRGAFGFNPLAVPAGTDPYPHVLELISVFKKLWYDAWGARMEDVMRNSFLALAEYGGTLTDVPRLLTDEDYRTEVISQISNPQVIHYFTERLGALAPKTRSEWIDSTLNKVSTFVSDPRIRAVVGQPTPTVDLRAILDRPGTVLLITLPKGILKENTGLLAALLVSHIQSAALSRTDTPEEQRQPFHLYIDEFQHFGAKSLNFQEILAEARKYQLFLTLAHQNADQLDWELLSSVLSNTPCKIAFRIRRHDAECIAKEVFQVDIPDMEWERENNISSLNLEERWEDYYNALTGLDDRHAYAVMDHNGSWPVRTEEAPTFPLSDHEHRVQTEFLLAPYCRPAAEVAEEIAEREQTAQAAGADNPTEF